MIQGGSGVLGNLLSPMPGRGQVVLGKSQRHPARRDLGVYHGSNGLGIGHPLGAIQQVQRCSKVTLTQSKLRQ